MSTEETSDLLTRQIWLQKQILKINASESFKSFVAYTKPDYIFKWFNEYICNKIDAFEKGKIKKLMIFAPPQHGKSELTTRRTPPYLLGKNPDRRIALCSYSADLAKSFNRDIQRIIDDRPYSEVFPHIGLNESNVVTVAKGSYLRNSEIFEIVGHSGFVKTVGVGGPLTGTPVDIGIIDDPHKNREEAKSPTMQQKVYEWYVDVFKTRLHNDSQQLIMLTRWDQNDLAGRILKEENDWELIIFPAIKEAHLNEYDPRKIGEVLFPEKHSKERILDVKKTNPVTFQSLYQQDPKPAKEALVYNNWKEVEELPEYPSVAGMDFGYSNDPTAVVEVRKHRDRAYCKQWLYKKGLTNNLIKLELLNAGFPIHLMIYADSEDPKTIAELGKKSVLEAEPSLKSQYPNCDKYIRDGYYHLPALNIRKARKGQGSLSAGISLVQDLKMHYTKDSNMIKYELGNYQWQTVGGELSNEPLEGNDHIMDAIRYPIFTLYGKRKAFL